MRRCFALQIALIFVALVSASGEARMWRASPQALAQDYVQILDQRSPDELVMIFWISPQIIPPTPGADLAKRILADSVMIGLVHADVSLTGTFSFRTPTDIELQLDGAAPRRPLADAEVEPDAATVLTVFQTMFEGAMGDMGAGTNWFIFDGTGIASCRRGHFAIAYAGESYTYDTPIPGCSKRDL